MSNIDHIERIIKHVKNIEKINTFTYDGWIPDINPNGSRYKISDGKSKLKLKKISSLPLIADISYSFPPIFDEGNIKSCTANAVCAAYQYIMNKEGEIKKNMSRLFLYFVTRDSECTADYDSGAQIKDTLGVIGNDTTKYVGLCLEDYWPYDQTKVNVRPPNTAYSNAKLNRVVNSVKIKQNIDDIRQCIASGYPIIFGFVMFESFNKIKHTGVMPMPSNMEQVIGGHVAVIVGYDDNSKYVTVRNSWGNKWGNNGYFFIRYDFITNPNFASDFWTIDVVRDSNNKCNLM